MFECGNSKYHDKLMNCLSRVLILSTIALKPSFLQEIVFREKLEMLGFKYKDRKYPDINKR